MPELPQIDHNPPQIHPRPQTHPQFVRTWPKYHLPTTLRAILDDILRDIMDIGTETTQSTPNQPPINPRSIPERPTPTHSSSELDQNHHLLIFTHITVNHGKTVTLRAILNDILRDIMDIGPETTQSTPNPPQIHPRSIPDSPTVRQNLTKITIYPYYRETTVKPLLLWLF